MSLFGRRMTPELLAAELLRGIERGEVTHAPDTGTEATLTQLCVRLQTLVTELLATQDETARQGRVASLAQLKDEIGQVAKKLGAA